MMDIVQTPLPTPPPYLPGSSNELPFVISDLPGQFQSKMQFRLDAYEERATDLNRCTLLYCAACLFLLKEGGERYAKECLQEVLEMDASLRRFPLVNPLWPCVESARLSADESWIIWNFVVEYDPDTVYSKKLRQQVEGLQFVALQLNEEMILPSLTALLNGESDSHSEGVLLEKLGRIIHRELEHPGSKTLSIANEHVKLLLRRNEVHEQKAWAVELALGSPVKSVAGSLINGALRMFQVTDQVVQATLSPQRTVHCHEYVRESPWGKLMREQYGAPGGDVFGALNVGNRGVKEAAWVAERLLDDIGRLVATDSESSQQRIQFYTYGFYVMLEIVRKQQGFSWFGSKSIEDMLYRLRLAHSGYYPEMKRPEPGDLRTFISRLRSCCERHPRLMQGLIVDIGLVCGKMIDQDVIGQLQTVMKARLVAGMISSKQLNGQALRESPFTPDDLYFVALADKIAQAPTAITAVQGVMSGFQHGFTYGLLRTVVDVVQVKTVQHVGKQIPPDLVPFVIAGCVALNGAGLTDVFRAHAGAQLLYYAGELCGRVSSWESLRNILEDEAVYWMDGVVHAKDREQLLRIAVNVGLPVAGAIAILVISSVSTVVFALLSAAFVVCSALTIYKYASVVLDGLYINRRVVVDELRRKRFRQLLSDDEVKIWVEEHLLEQQFAERIPVIYDVNLSASSEVWVGAHAKELELNVFSSDATEPVALIEAYLNWAKKEKERIEEELSKIEGFSDLLFPYQEEVKEYVVMQMLITSRSEFVDSLEKVARETIVTSALTASKSFPKEKEPVWTHERIEKLKESALIDSK